MTSGEGPLHMVTPTIQSMPLSKLTGLNVYLKLENLQIPGSFKIRGIGNLIKKASQHGCKKIVCASGGNAGLAAAYAAKTLGIPATIVLPQSTPGFVADKLRNEGPPGERLKEELEEEHRCRDVWNRRFLKPLSQSRKEQFKERLKNHTDQDYSFNEAYAQTANDELPYLMKKLRKNYAEFLIYYYILQEDPTRQQILQTAKILRSKHNMNIRESVQQAIKLRKDFFKILWPNHKIDDVNKDDHKNDDLSENHKSEEK